MATRWHPLTHTAPPPAITLVISISYAFTVKNTCAGRKKNNPVWSGWLKKRWSAWRSCFSICSLWPYYNSNYVSDCAAQPVSSSSWHADTTQHRGSVSQWEGKGCCFSWGGEYLRRRDRTAESQNSFDREQRAREQHRQGRFFFSSPSLLPRRCGWRSGVIVTVYPVLQTAH